MNIDRDELTKKLRSNGYRVSFLQFVDDCEIKPVDCNECAMGEEVSSIVCMSCENNKGLRNNFIQKEKEWYEKPLSFPVLCWVNDDNYNSKDTVALITSFLETECLFIESSQNNWMYATPLTKEELLNYCVGEK